MELVSHIPVRKRRIRTAINGDVDIARENVAVGKRKVNVPEGGGDGSDGKKRRSGQSDGNSETKIKAVAVMQPRREQ